MQQQPLMESELKFEGSLNHKVKIGDYVLECKTGCNLNACLLFNSSILICVSSQKLFLLLHSRSMGVLYQHNKNLQHSHKNNFPNKQPYNSIFSKYGIRYRNHQQFRSKKQFYLLRACSAENLLETSRQIIFFIKSLAAEETDLKTLVGNLRFPLRTASKISGADSP